MTTDSTCGARAGFFPAGRVTGWSEFPAVVIPLAMQQYMLLQRNLVYTGITRGKKLVVLIGQRKAMAMAVKNNRTESLTSLTLLVRGFFYTDAL